MSALEGSASCKPSLPTELFKDLEVLCHAGQHCSVTLHQNLVPLFKKCALPLAPLSEQVSSFYPVNNSSSESLIESILVEDYASPVCQTRDSIPSGTPSPDSDESQGLLKSIIKYPLGQLQSLAKVVSGSTPRAQPRTQCANVDHGDRTLANHAQYQTVLKRAAQLLATITDQNTEKLTVLTKLKKHISSLQTTVAATIEQVESDRESFNVLLGCIHHKELSLSDSLLLQYGKMGQYQASLDTMLTEFGLAAKKVSEVSQEEFLARWRAIQQQHSAGTLDAASYNALRQYTYVLQNPTARYLTQKFLEGSINELSMNFTEAQERGLTPERIDVLTYELSNCKDFLLKLHKAFGDAIKTIDAKLP